MTYRFGRFSIDNETRQLLADGDEVHLSPKAFALLLTLVQHHARALSKTELQDQLWPGTFIGETNLATLVAEVRRALDDSAHRSEYVRTVHRFGYRFVAGVVDASASPPAVHPGARMYLRTADQQFPLLEGATVISRGADAVIRIDSGGVSRHHARIVVIGNEASVEDLGSKNGTFLRGHRIAQCQRLTDGDEIRVGPILVIFKIVAATEPTETMR